MAAHSVRWGLGYGRVWKILAHLGTDFFHGGGRKVALRHELSELSLKVHTFALKGDKALLLCQKLKSDIFKTVTYIRPHT